MKLVCGVGINDVTLCGPACYRDSSGRKVSLPDYEMWKGMLLRCFSDKEKSRRPACLNSSCSDEWKIRYNFQKWYFSHTEHYANDGTKLHLDKDIILYGNTLSEELCCLVPQYLNQGIRDATRAEIPWVRYVDKPKQLNPLKKPWRASVFNQGKHIELGMFSTHTEAHKAAQLCKASVILNTLLPLYREEKCYREEVEEGLLYRVTILENDARNGLITRLQ